MVLSSSNVDSCCLRIVRIFNIISLHFGERGGTTLATLCCNVGLLASRPGRMKTLTHCYSDWRTLLCDVTGAH
jgi:hypothetical protein